MMNVKKMKVANFKYYIVLALCAVVITLSIISIIKRPKETSSVTQRQGPFDPELYYNKEMPNFERDGKEREINFPTNKNILILGVNREVAETIQRYDRLFEKLDFSAYDVEIIILTNREEHRESKYVKIYYYNNAEFDRYFKIGEESKFVLLVNKENRIKHYMDRMIALHNIRLLIERFRSKERNES